MLALEPKALRVLFYLIENRDRIITKEELISHIWAGAFVTDFTLTRVIAQLRKQLGDDGIHLAGNTQATAKMSRPLSSS